MDSGGLSVIGARFLVDEPLWWFRQPRERGALVHGNVIGLAALDLVLRGLRARVMRVALIVDVLRMNPDDRAADAPGLRVPTDPIPDLEPFSHQCFPRRLRIRPSLATRRS
jgi:hypothetical protein